MYKSHGYPDESCSSGQILSFRFNTTITLANYVVVTFTLYVSLSISLFLFEIPLFFCEIMRLKKIIFSKQNACGINYNKLHFFSEIFFEVFFLVFFSVLLNKKGLEERKKKKEKKKKQVKMALNRLMHPENIYKEKQPNFLDLAMKYPRFAKFVSMDVAGHAKLDYSVNQSG